MRHTNKDKRIIFVEKLLRAYNSMKAERYNLNIKWNMLERQKDSAIEGQNIRAVAISDMPGTPRGSYKPSPVLMVKQDLEIQEIENEQAFIVERLKDLEDIITTIDGSLNSLEHMDKQVVVYYYLNRLSIEQIARLLYMSDITVKRKKQGAIYYMYKSLHVLEDTVIFK